MAGIVNSKYHKMGKDILAEQAANDGDGQDQENANDMMQEEGGSTTALNQEQDNLVQKANQIANQLLQSGAYDYTDGGIGAAVEEALKRVYQSGNSNLSPDQAAQAANSMDMGYAKKNDATAASMTDTSSPELAGSDYENQGRRPLPRPQGLRR